MKKYKRTGGFRPRSTLFDDPLVIVQDTKRKRSRDNSDSSSDLEDSTIREIKSLKPNFTDKPLETYKERSNLTLEQNEELEAKLRQFEKEDLEIQDLDHEETEDFVNESEQTVREKYSKKNFEPPHLNRSQLMKEADKHVHIVPQILNGVIDSYFYSLAKEVKESSGHEILTGKVHHSVDWSKFSTGYIGPKRTIAVAMHIKSVYSKILEETLKKSSVVSFWSLESFNLYVLAPEVISRIVMDQMDLSLKDSLNLMELTADYGKYIMDRIPFEDILPELSSDDEACHQELSDDNASHEKPLDEDIPTDASSSPIGTVW